MFIVEMVLFGIFTALLTLSQSYLFVVAALVGIGVALGSRTRVTSPNSFRAIFWPPRVRRSSTCC
jgi:hypothetical protein